MYLIHLTNVAQGFITAHVSVCLPELMSVTSMCHHLAHDGNVLWNGSWAGLQICQMKWGRHNTDVCGMRGIKCFIASMNWLFCFLDIKMTVLWRGWVWKTCGLRGTESPAAQGQHYMLACKSCCPKLSWEQQSSESSWFEKDKCIWYLACLNSIWQQ